MSATSDGDDIQTDYASAPHDIQPQNIIETVPSSPNRERVSEQIIHNSPSSSRSQQTLAGYFIGRRRSGATSDVPRPVPLNLGPAPPLPVFSISENQDASNVLVKINIFFSFLKSFLLNIIIFSFILLYIPL